MGQTLGYYRSQARADLGHPPTDILTDEELDSRINDSYFEILKLFHHRRLYGDSTISTTNGTAEYALPSDYWWMRLVKDEDNDKVLEYRRLEWIERQSGSSPGTDSVVKGQPLHWTTEDEHIRLYPVPDDSYTLRLWYVQEPSPLVNPQDTDLLSRDWSELIKLGAVARCFFLMGELDREVHTRNLWRRLIDQSVETLDLEARSEVDTTGYMFDKGKVTS